MQDVRANDTKKQMSDSEPVSVGCGDEPTVGLALDADETLALYSLLDRHNYVNTRIDVMLEDGERHMRSVQEKLAQRIKSSMRTAALLEEFKHSNTITAQIARGMPAAKKKIERYMVGQQEKIKSLEEDCASTNMAARELRRLCRDRASAVLANASGTTVPADNTVVEFDFDPFQDEERQREYPRRHPPAPIMPHMGGRRRARRRDRNKTV